MPYYLLTPRDWAELARHEASELLGTYEGRAKLVEANRYDALADEIDRLVAKMRAMEQAAAVTAAAYKAAIDRLAANESQAGELQGRRA